MDTITEVEFEEENYLLAEQQQLLLLHKAISAKQQSQNTAAEMEIIDLKKPHPLLIDHVIAKIVRYLVADQEDETVLRLRLVCQVWNKVATQTLRSHSNRTVYFGKYFENSKPLLDYMHYLKSSSAPDHFPVGKFYLCEDMFKTSNLQKVPMTQGVSFFIDCANLVTSLTIRLDAQRDLKSADLVDVMNRLYALPTVRNSIVIKGFMIMVPVISVGVTILYGGLVILTEYNPITKQLCPDIISSKQICTTLRTSLNIYEIWNFGVLVCQGSFVLFNGLFPSYLALWTMATAFLKGFDNSLKARAFYSLPKAFEKSLKQYVHLQLHTTLVNKCFQKLALGFKAEFMLMTSVLGAIMIGHKFRATASFAAFLTGIVTLFSMYFYMAVGYYFPGKVNLISLYVLKSWRNQLSNLSASPTSDTGTLKRYRKKVGVLQAVKIRFGTVNYYERGTALMILDFIVDKTIQLILVL